MGALGNLIKRARTLGVSKMMPFFVASNGVSVDATDVKPEYALKNSDVFAVVLRVSSDIAACKFITLPYFAKILSKPFGNVISSYSFWQSVLIQMMLYGNAVVWIHRASNGVITSLELIPWSQIEIQLNDNGDDLVYTAHFDDTKRSGDYKIKSSDVLHFRLMVTGEGGNIQYMGISPLIALSREINIQERSNQLSLATLAHAIAPTNLIKVPQAQLGKEAKDNIRNQFDSQYTGKNAGKTIVLDQSAELEQLTVTPDIAKFIANTSFSQEQIAKAFCIPADYLSGKQDAQSSIDSIRSFYQSSLSIYSKPIESELSSKLGTDVTLDFSSAIDTDHQQIIDNIDKLGKDEVLSINEIQKIFKERKIFPELSEDDIQQANTELVAEQSTSKPTEGGDDDNEQA